MYRYYFNPFTSVFLRVGEKDKAKLMAFGSSKGFEDLLTVPEIWKLLHNLYNTVNCFGKFDLFSKFIPIKLVFSSDDGIDTKERIRKLIKLLLLKTDTICYRCQKVDECSKIRIPLTELASIWDGIYFEKAEQYEVK